MKEDLQRYLDVAREAALLGGQYLRASFGQAVQSDYKGDRDPVTSADLEAEKIILKTLIENFPDHNYVSEETGKQETDSPFCWIIDPLDGTTNFLHGLAHFAVSIALQKEEITLIGVVYNPIFEEIFTATLGCGAFLNGSRIMVSDISSPLDSLLGTGFSTSLKLRRKQQQLLNQFLDYCGAIREPGSAAMGLCYVSCGIYDGYWESGLQPWDVAAGALLVMEAGGSATDLNGSPLQVRGGNVNILASNSRLHPALLRAIENSCHS